MLAVVGGHKSRGFQIMLKTCNSVNCLKATEVHSMLQDQRWRRLFCLIVSVPTAWTIAIAHGLIMEKALLPNCVRTHGMDDRHRTRFNNGEGPFA